MCGLCLSPFSQAAFDPTMTIRPLPTLLTLCLTATLLSPLAGLADGKPDRHDPVRKALVAAIRRHPALASWQGATLDIRRFWVSAHHAYVCTLVRNREGRYRMTGSLYDVHQLVFTQTEGQWTAVADLEGLSASPHQVQCATDPAGHIDDAFLSSLAANPQLALRAVAASAP